MDKKSFILYTDYLEQMECLNMKQRGILLTAFMYHQADMDLPDMDPITKVVYLSIVKDIDRNNAKFQKRVDKAKQAAEARWRKNNNDACKCSTDACECSDDAKTCLDDAYECSDNACDAHNENVNENVNVNVNVNENVKETTQRKAEYFADQELNQAFCDYVAMRKKIKAPLTDRAITLAKNNLDKLAGENVSKKIAILERSVFNSWKGLYPLDDSRGKPNKFNNFTGRDYDPENLEKQLLGVK